MITTKKIEDREIAFVLLPEGATDPVITKLGNKVAFTLKNGEWDYHELPEGKWQFISLSQSITEEQAAGIMEKANDELVDIGDCHWKDYTSENWEKDCATALKSFFSLMESLRLYHKNPYDEPKFRDALSREIENDNSKFWKNRERWQESQSRTGNYAVLVRSLENK